MPTSRPTRVRLGGALALTTLALGTARAQGLVPRVASEGDDILSLTHVWSRMGDDDGTFDVDLGPAAKVSVENAQYDHAEVRVATVSKGDASVRMFDAATGRELWRADGREETECLAFTPDDRYLVTGGEDQPEIKVWDAATGALVREIDDNVSVEGMVFSPDSALLACGNDAGEVRLYDTRATDPRDWPAAPLYTLSLGGDSDAGGSGNSDVNQIAWTADGTALYAASRNATVQVFRRADFAAADPQPVRTYAGHTGSIKSVALSPDERLVASCSNWRTGNGGQPTPARVIVHDVASGAEVIHYVIPDGKVPETVRFSPDGAILIAGTSFENSPETASATYVWRASDLAAGTATPPQTVTWYEQEYFDFRNNCEQLLVGASDGSVRVFDVAIDTGAQAPADPWRLEAEKHDGHSGVRVAPGHIAGCDDGEWVRFDAVDVTGANRLAVRYASAVGAAGARVQLRLDAADGPVVGLLSLGATGAATAFALADTTLTEELAGVRDLYFRFAGADDVGAFDYFELRAGAPAVDTAGAGADTTAQDTSGTSALGSVAFAREMRVFPNPARDRVTVEWAGGAAAVRLFGGLGREVRRASVAAGEPRATLSVEGLAPGRYVLQVVSEAGAGSRVVVVR